MYKRILLSLKSIVVEFTLKTPVTHPRMSRRIAAGFLIWKIVSDLRIIFYIRIHPYCPCGIRHGCNWSENALRKNQTA